MNLNYYLFILAIVSPLELYSQSNIEIINKALQSCTEDQKDSLFYELYVSYRYDNLDSAKKYAEIVRSRSIKSNNKIYYVKSIHALGLIESRLLNFDKSFKLYKEGLKIAFDNNYHIGIIMMYNDIGTIEYLTQQYDKAIEYYLKAVKFAKLFNQPFDEAIAYNNIAVIFFKITNFNEALNYFNDCINIKNKYKITEDLETNYCNVGLCYIKLGNYLKAQETLNHITNHCKNCNSSEKVFYYVVLAETYYHMFDYYNAISYSDSSLKIAKTVYDYEKTINNYALLSDIYTALKNPTLAKQNLDSAFYLAIRLNRTDELILIYKSYAQIAEYNKDINNAYLNYKKYLNLKDSVFSNDLIIRIKNSLMSFQQSQNDILLQEKEWRIKRNRQFGYLISSVTFLLSIILFFSYRALILRRRLSERLDEMVALKTIELSDSNDKLKRSRDDLDSFLYRTSHDIRGPIATLMGLTNVARINGPEKITGALLEKMDITTNKVNEIINRLTNVSQLSSMNIEFTTINFPILVNEIISEIKNNSWIDKKIKFKLSGDIPAEIRTDKILIKIILFNLLENSFKFYDSRESEWFVELNINKHGQFHHISIIDNGIGIDSGISNRIFDFFFVASERRGAGLGLYQARLAIQKLGGAISLVSFKKPTCFNIRIPLV